MRDTRTGNLEVDKVVREMRDEIERLRREVASTRAVQFDRDQSRLSVKTKDGRGSIQIDIDDGEKSTPLRRDIDGRGMAIKNVKVIEAEEVKSSKGTVYIGRDVFIKGDGARAQLYSRDANGNILVEDDITGGTMSADFGTVSADTAAFGGVANYAGFEADGTLVFNGDATYWVDLNFPIVVRTVGVGIPSLRTIDVGGVISAPFWQINDTNQCEGKELPHSWKLGTSGTWHVHVLSGASSGYAADSYLRFKVDWLVANAGSAVSTLKTSTSLDLKIPAGTPNNTHLLYNIETVSLAGFGLATHIWPKLTRIATSNVVTYPPPTNDVFCTMLQMHIECDTVGSRQITTK